MHNRTAFAFLAGPCAAAATGLLLAGALWVAPAGAAQDAPDANAAPDQVIDPQVERRDVRVPRIPSNDWELGLFSGTYNTDHFGAEFVGGLRFGYHFTEDVFLEALYGQSRVSDSAFRQILPGGIFPAQDEILRYYELDAGYNVFPGEIFLGSRHAKISTIYVIGGIGDTRFVATNHETVTLGFGTRVFLTDWVAIQADVRDHVFSLDLLGAKHTTNNGELTAGVTFFF